MRAVQTDIGRFAHRERTRTPPCLSLKMGRVFPFRLFHQIRRTQRLLSTTTPARLGESCREKNGERNRNEGEFLHHSRTEGEGIGTDALAMDLENYIVLSVRTLEEIEEIVPIDGDGL